MGNITVRKIQLYPQGDKAEIDRAYKYIRNGMSVQSLMMNQCITAMYIAKLNKVEKEEWAELRRRYSRVPTSSKGSAYDFDMEKYPTGLPIAGNVPRTCEARLKKAMKDGLMYGRVSLPTFKSTMPLMIHNAYVSVLGTVPVSGGGFKQNGFYHGYDSPGELSYALEKEQNPDVHIKFANGITFDLILGNPHRSAELRSVIERIFSGEYKVCDSQLGLEDDRKIILYLTVDMPAKEREELDPNTVVGVNLGLSCSAACALNNNAYAREYIGNYDAFVRQRMKMQKERRSVQAALKDSKGGHGRKKKLHHLDQLSANERNFAKTYNHTISRRVVDFAVKNHAKYINLENLKGFSKQDRSGFVLRNWSYYELQTMIEYKAAREGIEVRYVAPTKTSHICSICAGEGTVNKDRQFICSDPNCKSHIMYKFVNTDFNAARNLAQCQSFVGADDNGDEAETKVKKIAKSKRQKG